MSAKGSHDPHLEAHKVRLPPCNQIFGILHEISEIPGKLQVTVHACIQGSGLFRFHNFTIGLQFS